MSEPAEQPTIAEWASQIVVRVLCEHPVDVQSSKLAAVVAALSAELPAASVRPSTPVLMFLDELSRARRFDEWHEDHGDVLWWKHPVVEPPYVGSPLCCGFTVETHGPGGLISRGQIGGWPFSLEDEAALFWVPIPIPQMLLERGTD